MNGRGHSFFPIVVLTLLAGVSVWLDRVTQQEPVARADKTRHEVDFSADKITLHRFDPTGKVQYILVADSMLHYADDESSELKNPRLNYLNRPEPVWVESRFASVNKDGTTTMTIRVNGARADSGTRTVITYSTTIGDASDPGFNL